MVPGENFCPKEWKLEYWGYLMAAYYTHQKSNWVCVDSQPETISPPSSGSGQTLWYPTEIECGSIECSRTRPNGYVQNREVTCAVCSPVTSRRTTVYTRYGRNFCPSGSTLVRNGFLAGSYFSHTGSGANFLCMTPNTTYADHNDNNQEGALLYGYEYETSSGALRSSEYRSVHNYEVCRRLLVGWFASHCTLFVAGSLCRVRERGVFVDVHDVWQQHVSFRLLVRLCWLCFLDLPR